MEDRIEDDDLPPAEARRRLRLGQRFVPLTLVPIRRELTEPILLGGKLRCAYDAVEIAEYLDTITGDRIPAAQMARHPDYKPTIRTGELALQKEAALSRLRAEVKRFAYFLLAFRNQRRGVAPPMDAVVKLYAKMTGQRATDVGRRYLPRLEEAGICTPSGVMYPIFQFAGTKARRVSHLGEDFAASARFALMFHRHQEDRRQEFVRTDAQATTRADTKPGTLDVPMEPPVSGGRLRGWRHGAHPFFFPLTTSQAAVRTIA